MKSEGARQLSSFGFTFLIRTFFFLYRGLTVLMLLNGVKSDVNLINQHFLIQCPEFGCISIYLGNMSLSYSFGLNIFQSVWSHSMNFFQDFPVDLEFVRLMSSSLKKIRSGRWENLKNASSIMLIELLGIFLTFPSLLSWFCLVPMFSILLWPFEMEKK